MPQLVGLECALCHERIASVAEGEFCTACGNPVHKRCVAPGGSRAGTCRDCGADAAAGAVHRERFQEEATIHLRRIWRYHAVSALVCLVAGPACLVFGHKGFMWALRTERGAFLLFLCAMFLGLLLLILAYAHLREL